MAQFSVKIMRPTGSVLSENQQRRVIPLAGVSLEAFRECPEGFPRYADNPTLSATVNNYLRENGLPETPARQVAETITAGGTNM